MRRYAISFRARTPRVWDWFASNKVRDEQADAVRFDLLKNTYRIERTADPQLYVVADDVARALSLDAPITIYQSQNPAGLNAALAYIPGEAHIVFSGPLKARLNEQELRHWWLTSLRTTSFGMDGAANC